MTEDSFANKTEKVLATISKLLELDGAAKEVAVLAMAEAETVQTDYDNWNGGTYIYTLYLRLPLKLYHRIIEEKQQIENNILSKLSITGNETSYYKAVDITLQLIEDAHWRGNAISWLRGNNINNQGRVRSDNIASRSHDGLLFRSNPEILLYKALKSNGVSFAPLPVFIRGGSSFQRIEPDFFVVKDGMMMVIEVDGDTVHTETPAEAHARTIMLLHEGVHFERVKATDCDSEEKAMNCAKNLILTINKLKKNTK